MKRNKLLPFFGKVLPCAALVMSLGVAAQADAKEDGNWMVRVRAIDVVPQEDSTYSGGRIKADEAIVPEIDLSYFFTPNIAVELIAATSKHDIKLKNTGSTSLGDAWLLPPTLTLQYHFTKFDDVIKPYVGAGVNYTMFYNESAGDMNTVQYNNSFGPALQAGFDVPIRDNWYFNVDVKKIWISSDVKLNGGAVRASVDLDPFIFGTGIGYRF